MQSGVGCPSSPGGRRAEVKTRLFALVRTRGRGEEERRHSFCHEKESQCPKKRRGPILRPTLFLLVTQLRRKAPSGRRYIHGQLPFCKGWVSLLGYSFPLRARKPKRAPSFNSVAKPHSENVTRWSEAPASRVGARIG